MTGLLIGATLVVVVLVVVAVGLDRLAKHLVDREGEPSPPDHHINDLDQ